MSGLLANCAGNRPGHAGIINTRTRRDDRDEVRVKTFECGACGNTVYFKNVRCLQCGHALGFQPTRLQIVALEPAGGTSFLEVGDDSEPVTYCANKQHGACNWLVPAGGESSLCVACAPNRTIPDLSIPDNLRAWRDVERAKKRLVYSLLRLGLPLDGTAVGKEPLAFDFISDALTGHLDGVITIAVGEADAVERERQRRAMDETYRSLLGHMRHESGHYYWMLLIEGTDLLDDFRKVFGNEQEDYAAALDRHHSQGPPADWSQKFVSAYASAHPWEDWAETWAHYLHMVDTLDTATDHKIDTRPLWSLKRLQNALQAFDPYKVSDFNALIERWIPLTLILNDINRSMGHGDFYPFTLPDTAIAKLRFVHRVIRETDLGPRKDIRKKEMGGAN